MRGYPTKVVHKKYIRKNGKTFGPYLYESKRVGEKVTTNYVGKNTISDDVRHYVFPFIIVFLLGIFIGIFVVYTFFPPHLTGKVTLDLKPVYTEGERLSGSLLVTLKQGELLPADSIALVTVGDVTKEISLRDLVDAPTAEGSFFIQGLRINGEGDGYGSPGLRNTSPSVSFQLELVSSDSETTSGVVSVQGSQGVSEVGSESSPGSGSSETTSGAAPSSPPSKAPPASAAVTAEVISENNIIDGSATKDQSFTYTLPSNTRARLVSGSVTVDGKSVSDDAVTLKNSDGEVTVSTDYSSSETGFGEDYIGASTLSISLNLSQFDILLDHSVPFSLKLYHGSQLVLQAQRYLVVQNAADSLSVDVDVVRQRITLGQPVKWTKHISLSDPATVTVNLPKDATDVSLVSSEESSVDTNDHVVVTTDTDGTDVSVDVNNVPVEGTRVESKERVENTGTQEIVHTEVQAVAPVTGNAVSGLASKTKSFARSISGHVVADSNPQENVVEIPEPVNSVTIEYYTDAPTSTETETETGKTVTITGPDTVHYQNVLAFTTLPISMGVTDPSQLSIYWVNEGVSVQPENVQDTDGDGIYDYVEWNVDHLSVQTFNIGLVPSLTPPTYSNRFIPTQTCAAESSAANGTYLSLCQGTYPSSCALAGDRVGCNDSITETNTFTQTTYGGISLTSYNSSVTDCKSIRSVFACYSVWNNISAVGGGEASFNVSSGPPVWTPLANGLACTISADADGGTSYSVVNSTCTVSTAQGSVICTNVTALEPWTCSNFFGSSGTRAKIRDEMTIAVAAETYSVYSDVLAFNVSYLPITDIYSCSDLNVPNTVYTQYTALVPTGSAPCINITAPNVTFNGNGFGISNSSYTGNAIYSNSTNTYVNYANVVISTSAGTGIYLNNSVNATVYNSVFTAYDGAVFDNANGTLINNSAFNGTNDGIRISNATNVQIVSADVITATNDGISFMNVTNGSIFTVRVYQGNHAGIDIFGGSNSSILATELHGITGAGIIVNASPNTYLLSSILNTTTGNALAISNALSVNTTLRNMTFSNTNAASNDLYFADASINRTKVIDTSVGKYSFTGFGGTLVVSKTNLGEIRFLQAINGSGANFSADIKLSGDYASVDSTQTGINKSANVTFYNLPNDYRSAAILLNNVSNCPASVCRNLTSLPSANVTFNVTSWSTYTVGILPCLSINACSEGNGCIINATCQLDNSECTGGICDFANFTISAPLYTGADNANNGNSLTLNVSGNFTFLIGNKIDFSGLNSTIGGVGGVVNITVPGLFNRTNAVFRGIGGYSTSSGAAGANGGILQINYHGLIGTSSSWTRTLTAGSSLDTGSGTAGATVQAKSLTCPRDEDVNGDGIINSGDIFAVTDLYNNVSTDNTFDSYVDIDCDSKLNVIDLAKSSFKFGRGA